MQKNTNICQAKKQVQLIADTFRLSFPRERQCTNILLKQA